MTEDERPIGGEAELDEAIRSAFADVQVSRRLKSSTMAAIRAARAAEGGTDPEGRQPTEPRMVKTGSAVPTAAATTGMPGTWASHATPEADASASRARPWRRRLTLRAVAAALCLVLIATVGTALYTTETAFASIAAQSEVTLGINRFGRVVSVDVPRTASDVDVDSLHLAGMTYEEAVATLAESGYLGSGDVDVEVSSDDQGQQQRLVKTTQTCLSEAGRSGSCNGDRYGQEGASAGQGHGQGPGQEQAPSLGPGL